MFKKSAAAARHKKKAQQLRKRKTEDDDADDEDEEDNPNSTNNTSSLSLSVQLTETKKRRQLLTQLQYKRGVDATELLLSQPTCTDCDKHTAKNHNQNLTQTQTSSEGHVWDQKHKAAMEDFVQQQLQKNQLIQSTNNSEMDETKRQEQSSYSLSKEDLYQQLARKASQLSGKPLARDEINGPVDMPVSESIDTSHEVLTAGAATAMAEVVLPVEHDWAVIAETAKVVAQRRHQQPQKSSKNNMPHRVVPSANPAVPNRFRATNSARIMQHQQPHQGEQLQQQSTNKKDTDRSEDKDGELGSSSTVSSTVAVGNPVPDQERVGFAIARQQQQQQNRPFQRQASERNNQKYGRSSDERVYRQFLKRTREHQR